MKPRNVDKPEDKELQQRLLEKMKRTEIISYDLTIEDLQEVEILENRMRLGKGELSSIAFAKKIQQAFCTDDQNARKLASVSLGEKKVQTTPHLLGWLIFAGKLLDAEKTKVIEEHTQMKGPLERHFEEIYLRALEYRLLSSQSQKDGATE